VGQGRIGWLIYLYGGSKVSVLFGNDGDGDSVMACLLIRRQWAVCSSQRNRDLQSEKNETASIFSST
jgi:hypothetical protein